MTYDPYEELLPFDETEVLVVKECLAAIRAFNHGNVMLQMDMNKRGGSRR